MLRIALSLSLLAAVVTPLTANASGLDLITITTNSGGPVYTFTVPNNPIPGTVATDYFILNNVAATDSSSNYSGNDSVYFYDTSFGGGLEDDTLGTFVLSLAGPMLYSGSTTNPTFLVGTSGALTDSGAGSTTGRAYSYSITSVSSTAPEPSSVMLLGTGLLGLAGAVRRKLFVNA